MAKLSTFKCSGCKGRYDMEEFDICPVCGLEPREDDIEKEEDEENE